MTVKFNTWYGSDTCDLSKLVMKYYPHNYTEGAELSNTDVIETDKFVFIATHLYKGEDCSQSYFLFTLCKDQLNEVVFNDSNAIDPDKYITAHECATKTYQMFKYLLNEYDYEGTGVRWVQRNPPRVYKKFSEQLNN